MLRRLRGRFGISAPQVAIRTHVPWHMRAIVIVGAIVSVLALTGWAFEVGRRGAGFDQSESGAIISELRQANTALEEEVARLRSLLSGNESGLQIERAAQRLLTEKNMALLEENAKLKEELAIFERLAKFEGKTDDEVSLDRLNVRAEAGGKYQYSFLIALQGARRGKEAKLGLEVVVSEKGTGSKVILPPQNTIDHSQYEIVLRNFRRIEGKFEVPPNFIVGTVEVKIFEAGALKASKSLTLEESRNVRKER